MPTYNLTREQKEKLIDLESNCENFMEVLDYFKSIRPKSYSHLLRRVFLTYGMHCNKWKIAERKGHVDDIILDTKNAILENSGCRLNENYQFVIDE